MTTIHQHGFWQPYVPDPFPEGVPPFIMFAQRESDGIDWYEFLKGDELQADSVKMTVMQTSATTAWQTNVRWVVQAVNPDATMLFPANSLLVEAQDSLLQIDPQSYFGQREFFPDINEFGETPPPAVISRLQFFQVLAMRSYITMDEALAAMQHGAIPAEIERFIATLTAADQFAARMQIAGATVFERGHPLVGSLAAYLGITDQQLDEIWRQGAAL
jgi:hypothetical protein